MVAILTWHVIVVNIIKIVVKISTFEMKPTFERHVGISEKRANFYENVLKTIEHV